MQRNKRFYYEVIKELNLNDPIEALWEQALAESGGNETVAKALYLRYRAAQLARMERNAVGLSSSSEASKLAGERSLSAATRRQPFRPLLYLLLIAFFIVVVLSQFVGS